MIKLTDKHYKPRTLGVHNSVYVGADPEILLQVGRSSVIPEPYPVCGLIGGTKEKPLPILDIEPSGFAVQEDNVAVEFNIPPCKTSLDFVRHINKAVIWLKEKMEKLPKIGDESLFLSTRNEARYKREYLNNPKAMEFGCSVDFDAYNSGHEAKQIDRQSIRDDSGGELRFAGGHVHLGWDVVPDIPPMVVAAFLDAYVYLPVLSLLLLILLFIFYVV